MVIILVQIQRLFVYLWPTGLTEHSPTRTQPYANLDWCIIYMGLQRKEENKIQSIKINLAKTFHLKTNV